jgi:hypothetical protein
VPDPLEIYRGCCEHNRHGFSWTLDRQRAERFAAWAQECVHSSQRYLLSCKLPHRHVLAYITTRNEAEIVALPECVANVQVEDITHLPAMTEAMIKRLGKASK